MVQPVSSRTLQATRPELQLWRYVMGDSAMHTASGEVQRERQQIAALPAESSGALNAADEDAHQLPGAAEAEGAELCRSKLII